MENNRLVSLIKQIEDNYSWLSSLCESIASRNECLLALSVYDMIVLQRNSLMSLYDLIGSLPPDFVGRFKRIFSNAENLNFMRDKVLAKIRYADNSVLNDFVRKTELFV